MEINSNMVSLKERTPELMLSWLLIGMFAKAYLVVNIMRSYSKSYLLLKNLAHFTFKISVVNLVPIPQCYMKKRTLKKI